MDTIFTLAIIVLAAWCLCVVAYFAFRLVIGLVFLVGTLLILVATWKDG